MSDGTSEQVNMAFMASFAQQHNTGTARVAGAVRRFGADPDFAKYFAKYALPAGREKFPEISPVWGLELHQTP